MSNHEVIYANRVRCKKCGDILESKSVHDFKQCRCESVFTDGGKDYIRRGGKNLSDIEDLSLTTYNGVKLGSNPEYFWEHLKPAFTWKTSVTLRKGKNDCQPFQNEDDAPYLLVKLISYDSASMPTIDELKEVVTDYVRYDDSFKKKGMSVVNKLLKDKYQRILPTREYPVKLYIYGGDDSSYTCTTESVGMAQLVLQEVRDIAARGGDLWSFLIDNMVQTN